MRVERTIISLVLVGLAASAGGCGEAGQIRRVEDEEQQLTAAPSLDAELIATLKSPEAPGRLIYDAPPDLSLANAQKMRPDLARPDAAPKADTTQPARRSER
jgi:hypothetical protein